LPSLPAAGTALPPGLARPRNDAELLAAYRTLARPVVLVSDAFTRYLEPAVLAAAARVLTATGATPVLLPYRPSGKALHVQGFMRRFRRLAAANARRFERLAAHEVPLVAVEPAVAVALNEDYDD